MHDINSSIMRNALFKTGRTNNHARLGLPYKSRPIKGLVVGIAVTFDLLNGLTPSVVINRPLSYQSEIQFIGFSIV